MRQRRLPTERQTGPWILSSAPLFITPPPLSTEGGEHQPAAKNTQQHNLEKHTPTHQHAHTHTIIDRLTDMDVFFFFFQKTAKYIFRDGFFFPCYFFPLQLRMMKCASRVQGLADSPIPDLPVISRATSHPDTKRSFPALHPCLCLAPRHCLTSASHAHSHNKYGHPMPNLFTPTAKPLITSMCLTALSAERGWSSGSQSWDSSCINA